MMPTDSQLLDYIGQLPQIYKDILAEFPRASETRRVGDGLSLDTVIDQVSLKDSEYRSGDIIDAVNQLIIKGFLIGEKKSPFIRPTEISERLITLLTGKTPKPAKIPELPLPVWS